MWGKKSFKPAESMIDFFSSLIPCFVPQRGYVLQSQANDLDSAEPKSLKSKRKNEAIQYVLMGLLLPEDVLEEGTKGVITVSIKTSCRC